MHMKRFFRILEQHMKKMFPVAKLELYVSRRNNYVHMGSDRPLFFLLRNNLIIQEIRGFMKEELDDRFKTMFPQLVSTVKWKCDYIIFKNDLKP